MVGPPAVTRQLLHFAALHGIRAQTEVFRRDQIDHAVDHVRGGHTRYRAVLDLQ